LNNIYGFLEGAHEMMPRKYFKTGWAVLLSVSLALLLPVIALAAFISVNTDDTAIDPDWSSVTVFYTSAGNNAGIPDPYEIKQAWVARESDNSFWYFRVILYGQLPMDDFSSVEARISCNGNTNFFEAGDNVVLYYHANPATNDNVIECMGAEYPGCSGSNSEPLKGSDFGEETAVGDGTYSYEWKADIGESGDLNWTTCNGQETMEFAAVDDTLTVQDTTPTRDFDVPTDVHLNRLEAIQGDSLALPMLIGFGLLLGIALLLMVRSRFTHFHES
jgi:hypothetical protein